MVQQRALPDKWLITALRLAGCYNLLWAVSTLLFPQAYFQFAGMAPLNHPGVWQGMGMLVGIYGIGYLIAAYDPYRHWPIVLVGLLGKLLAPIGFLYTVYAGDFTWRAGYAILLNDVIWWVPFSLLLYQTLRHIAGAHTVQVPSLSFPAALRYYRMSDGQTLAEAAEKSPVLVVFLRHLGCSFCQEALSDLEKVRASIESRGVKLALVHMSDPFSGRAAFSRWGLTDVSAISDPACELYAVFGLGQGTLRQLFGIKSVMRGLALMKRGYKVGRLQGDGLRMPGVFLISHGRIVKEFRHTSVADKPDYTAMAEVDTKR
ncbi:MAG: SelL-related redox protein [Verrucomicrobiota bacterium]|nr:SelL-related redox protein [Verrucomicrobiota bacterium]